jgi:hypothetical protein
MSSGTVTLPAGYWFGSRFSAALSRAAPSDAA